jgi:hypothetical protein
MGIGWIGVDLDGTLARYTGWVNETHIGEPVPLMVRRVKQWIAEGQEVRIFTARAAKTLNYDGSSNDTGPVLWAIAAWCIKHIGQPLKVTNEKDYEMVALYDDRAVQIITNTGERADGADYLST